jgi:hypothetical protein
MGIYVSMRFLTPLIASLIHQALPVLDLIWSFAFLNCFFWFGGMLVAYGIGLRFGGRVSGFLCGLFYTTSISVLAYGDAVLTDSSGYFFVGLALYFTLRQSEFSKLRTLLGSAILAIGGFCHPTSFVGLLFYLFSKLKYRCKVLWALAGAGLVLVLVLEVVDILTNGVLRNLPSFAWARFVYSAQSLNRPGLGLPIELAWTFDLFPIQALDQLRGVRVPVGTDPVRDTLEFACFVVTAVVGFWYAGGHRKLLTLYLPFLALFPFLAPFFIDRYLFTLWPFFIPVLVTGVRNIARLPAKAVLLFLKKTRLSAGLALANPDLYAIIFLFAIAIRNSLFAIGLDHTAITLIYLGPSFILRP